MAIPMADLLDDWRRATEATIAEKLGREESVL
jgi:hypothetical protein